MPLTKEQLLIPRVMCIGGKEGEPNDTSGEFITGKILTVGTIVQFGLQVFAASEQLLTEICTKFPHLFKPLPWWEMRDKSDLPEYVSYKNKGVFKVDVWDLKYQEAMIFVGDIITTVDIELLQPADLTDYQEYQKQKQ